jgi:hypothetical protein
MRVLPSLPEPRRRIDLALWAVVVEVSMSVKDAPITASGATTWRFRQFSLGLAKSAVAGAGWQHAAHCA